MLFSVNLFDSNLSYVTFPEKTCHTPIVNESILMTPGSGIYYVDDVVYFVCDSGYEYDSGYWEQRCLTDGSWSHDEQFKCKSKNV